MAKSMKELSAESQAAFRAIVTSAVPVPDEEALFTVGPQGGRVRVKRAKSVANQVQVARGEPIALHVCRSKKDGTPGPERWFVLPVSWQLKYASANPKAAQHASHPFDCMAVRVSSLPRELEVSTQDLEQKCAHTAAVAAEPLNAKLVDAINRTRFSVANILIETLGEVVSAVAEEKVRERSGG